MISPKKISNSISLFWIVAVVMVYTVLAQQSSMSSQPDSSILFNHTQKEYGKLVSNEIEHQQKITDAQIQGIDAKVSAIKDGVGLVYTFLCVVSVVLTIFLTFWSVAAFRREKRNDEHINQLHDQIIKIGGLQKENLEHVNNVIASVGKSMDSNVEPLSKIMTLISQILKVKLDESELAVKSQIMIEDMDREIKNLKNARTRQLEIALECALQLKNYPRHVFENPSDELRELSKQFEFKVEAVWLHLLDEQVKKESRFAPIYLHRGIIAYHNDDPSLAKNMLKMAEECYPCTRNNNLNTDIKFPTAFTQYYLALFAVDYGTLREAKSYIDNSNDVLGSKDDLLTRIVRAEICYYKKDNDGLREQVDELQRLFEDRKTVNNPLKPHEIGYKVRMNMLMGDASFTNGEYNKAKEYYEKALDDEEDNPFIHFALGRVNQEMSRPDSASKSFEKALQHMRVRYQHGNIIKNTKNILLNESLMFHCLRELHQEFKDNKIAILSIIQKIPKDSKYRLCPFSLIKRQLADNLDEYSKEIV